jgi:EAL domain-containing protein (putative c-di-GMP-specific phosphodiesterase class I)
MGHSFAASGSGELEKNNPIGDRHAFIDTKERVSMPLQQLVEYFNQRFSEEQGLEEPPLHLNSQQVVGHFDGLNFSTILQPIRLTATPSRIVGYDAMLRINHGLNAKDHSDRLLFADHVSNIVDLDRLSRTVHMLNYLPRSHDEGSLFLQVHPRHVLAVKKDHGAYFEEIILRCGLTPRRVVITLPLSSSYGKPFNLLLDRLQNYYKRGYATSIKFNSASSDSFIERNCIDFLYRFTPDFIRFDCDFFSKLTHEPEKFRRRSSLWSAIRRLDTQLLMENIDTEAGAQFAAMLGCELVKGEYYERSGDAFMQQKAV